MVKKLIKLTLLIFYIDYPEYVLVLFIVIQIFNILFTYAVWPMITWYLNLIRMSSEISILIIYGLILHSYRLYYSFEGDVNEEDMNKYFNLGFHINNSIYAFLGINLFKFFVSIYLSLKRLWRKR